MKIQELKVNVFTSSPSFLDLFSALRHVFQQWWRARFLNFRELTDREATDDLRHAAAVARNSSRDDLVNL